MRYKSKNSNSEEDQIIALWYLRKYLSGSVSVYTYDAGR